MTDLIVTVSNDNSFYEISNSDKVYIFENVKEYESEICEMFEHNKMTYQDIKRQVESWGGKVDLVSLSMLVKNYQKKFKRKS